MLQKDVEVGQRESIWPINKVIEGLLMAEINE